MQPTPRDKRTVSCKPKQAPVVQHTLCPFQIETQSRLWSQGTTSPCIGKDGVSPSLDHFVSKMGPFQGSFELRNPMVNVLQKRVIPGFWGLVFSKFQPQHMGPKDGSLCVHKGMDTCKLHGGTFLCSIMRVFKTAAKPSARINSHIFRNLWPFFLSNSHTSVCHHLSWLGGMHMASTGDIPQPNHV